MAELITVKVCTGTACYVMGASDILLLEENLPPSLRDRVRVEGSACLGLCHGGKSGSAPYVSVNGEILTGASLHSVLQRIREIANV